MPLHLTPCIYGYRNTPQGQSSQSFGTLNFLGGESVGSIAVGLLNNANITDDSSYSWETGVITYPWGVTETTATRAACVAVGILNQTAGAYSTAVGARNSVSSGYGATAVGMGNTASDYNATAVGYGNTASGNGATAFGYNNTASGQDSSAFGNENVASGEYATVSGYNSTASGKYATASGYHSTASNLPVFFGCDVDLAIQQTHFYFLNAETGAPGVVSPRMLKNFKSFLRRAFRCA